ARPKTLPHPQVERSADDAEARPVVPERLAEGPHDLDRPSARAHGVQQDKSVDTASIERQDEGDTAADAVPDGREPFDAQFREELADVGALGGDVEWRSRWLVRVAGPDQVGRDHAESRGEQ